MFFPCPAFPSFSCRFFFLSQPDTNLHHLYLSRITSLQEHFHQNGMIGYVATLWNRLLNKWLNSHFRSFTFFWYCVLSGWTSMHAGEFPVKFLHRVQLMIMFTQVSFAECLFSCIAWWIDRTIWVHACHIHMPKYTV